MMVPAMIASQLEKVALDFAPDQSVLATRDISTLASLGRLTIEIPNLGLKHSTKQMSIG
jgi:hypothetical protein